jgi:hypothetical protein
MLLSRVDDLLPDFDNARQGSDPAVVRKVLMDVGVELRDLTKFARNNDTKDRSSVPPPTATAVEIV